MRVDLAPYISPPSLAGYARWRVTRLARQTAQEKVDSPDDNEETDHDADPMKDICH
jgi:hypothetical protein